MPELHRPPLLVAVARSGAVHPALLLASRGPGANHLVWVAADDLRPGTHPVLTGSQVVVPVAR